MTAAALALAALQGPASAGPLDAYRWRSRVLVLSAPDADDPGLRAQRRILASVGPGLAERDLVVLEAIGRDREASALRRALDLPGNAFQAVLVGKDGTSKLRSRTPLPSERLFMTIDAMPMRREEMKR